MAENNSTVLNNETDKPEYSDFATDFSYRLYRVKAMIAGARSMVYECESEFSKNPVLLDSAYLLDDIVERITELAKEISGTEFDYQAK